MKKYGKTGVRKSVLMIQTNMKRALNYFILFLGLYGVIGIKYDLPLSFAAFGAWIGWVTAAIER